MLAPQETHKSSSDRFAVLLLLLLLLLLPTPLPHPSKIHTRLLHSQYSFITNKSCGESLKVALSFFYSFSLQLLDFSLSRRESCICIEKHRRGTHPRVFSSLGSHIQDPVEYLLNNTHYKVIDLERVKKITNSTYAL
ncbi:hypothetical protein F5H01DRAFT_166307 [Linnemannia elongata]|nr:hypothetical protein F5H01DRAFT_166307 [Linnemannia elongata]